MKKVLLFALAMNLPMLAFAQQQPPQGGQGQFDPQKFQERKTRVLEGIDRRIDTLQQAKSCVQQAQDPQALRACRPERREGDRGGKQPSN